MRKADATFLATVFAFALAFVIMTVTALPRPAGIGAFAIRASGQARDVDMPKLERLLRERRLSTHEADFYHRVEPTGDPLLPRPSSNDGPATRTGSP